MARVNPLFCVDVNSWTTAFWFTLFMGWWERGRKGTTWRQFGPFVLLVIDSEVPLDLQSCLEFTLYYCIFLYQGSKGRAVWGSEKAVKFSYNPCLSVLVHFVRNSLSHTETMLASVTWDPQGFCVNCSESRELSYLSCGIFIVALDEEAGSLC